MIERTSMFLIASTLLVLASEDWAAARSTTASTGRARLDQDRGCFEYNNNSGAVFSICSADYIVPLTTDHSGTKSIRFTSRREAIGGQTGLCRAVANDPFGTAVSVSSFRQIPVDTDYQAQTTGSVVVPHMGVFFLDCIMPFGTRLNQFDYPD